MRSVPDVEWLSALIKRAVAKELISASRTMSDTAGAYPLRSPRLTRFVAAVLATAFLAAFVRPGPSTADIDRIQTQADAQIDALAGRGRLGTESAAATDRREP